MTKIPTNIHKPFGVYSRLDVLLIIDLKKIDEIVPYSSSPTQDNPPYIYKFLKNIYIEGVLCKIHRRAIEARNIVGGINSLTLSSLLIMTF